MPTPILIDNRISAFLGMPPGDGKWPAVIHLHERYGIVRHTMHQERSLSRFDADSWVNYDFTRMKRWARPRFARNFKSQISYLRLQDLKSEI